MTPNRFFKFVLDKFRQPSGGVQLDASWVDTTAVVGTPGPQGPIGSQGVQGEIGPQGMPGLQGVQGPAGLKGDTGNQGAQGIQGLTGPQGIQGPTGLKGDTGNQGPQGLTGLKGDAGNQGVQGLTGPQGVQGGVGSQGIQGPSGVPAPIVAITSSKTLALSDANTTQICTAVATITIPPNAAVAFPVGTELLLLRNTSATVTLALAGGVTVTDRNGNTDTLTQVTNFTALKKTGTDTWIAINSVPNNLNLPGTPTCNTQPLGTDSLAIANTAFVQAAISEFPASFTAVVPLQSSKSYPTQTVTGLIAFTLSSATKSACARTTYRLIANGVNVPTFTGFTESSESIGYYNSNGILNIIVFEWDGFTAWYKISQAKFAMPAFSTLAISFPLRSASVAINGSNAAIYGSTDAEGVFWSSLMVSTQTIPSGKYGRITVGAHPNIMLGLNNSGSLEPYQNFEYAVFGASGKIFTIGTTGGAAIDSAVAISATAERFYRLTRFSNGTVTAETSPDNVTWSLVTTFGATNTGVLYVAAALSGNQANRTLRIVSFELEL